MELAKTINNWLKEAKGKRELADLKRCNFSFSQFGVVRAMFSFYVRSENKAGDKMNGTGYEAAVL